MSAVVINGLEINGAELLLEPALSVITQLQAERDELVAALRELLNAHLEGGHGTGRRRTYDAEEAARALLAKYPEGE